jgi:hypothetical protein
MKRMAVCSLSFLPPPIPSLPSFSFISFCFFILSFLMLLFALLPLIHSSEPTGGEEEIIDETHGSMLSFFSSSFLFYLFFLSF